MRKRGKKVLALGVSASLLCTAVFMGTKLGVKADPPPLENPTLDGQNLTVWDLVYFGNYYQSNDQEMEPIKWRVLSVSNDSALLMSEKVLDTMAFDSSFQEVSWADSDLRSWLNGTFYNTAFTAEEQSIILTSTISNPGNYQAGMEDDPATSDKIYCPSMEEMESGELGFGMTIQAPFQAREAEATAYALSKGLISGESNGIPTGAYWLRTSAPGTKMAYSMVAPNGAYYANSNNVPAGGVRPVLRIDISEDEEQTDENGNPTKPWSYVGKKNSEGTETVWEEPTTEEPTTEEPTTEEPTTEEPTTEEETTTEAEVQGIEVNGYQINYKSPGTRIIYTVTDKIDDKNVVERGLVFGVGGYANEEDVYVGSESEYVISNPANELGPVLANYSETLKSGTSYRMTLKFAKGNAKEFTNGWYVRAYAKLSDNTYVYSDVESYNIYEIADQLYQNLNMPNLEGHQYLYNNILSIVNPDYPEIVFQ
jgi:hypothetical protein